MCVLRSAESLDKEVQVESTITGRNVQELYPGNFTLYKHKVEMGKRVIVNNACMIVLTESHVESFISDAKIVMWL